MPVKTSPFEINASLSAFQFRVDGHNYTFPIGFSLSCLRAGGEIVTCGVGLVINYREGGCIIHPRVVLETGH